MMSRKKCFSKSKQISRFSIKILFSGRGIIGRNDSVSTWTWLFTHILSRRPHTCVRYYFMHTGTYTKTTLGSSVAAVK